MTPDELAATLGYEQGRFLIELRKVVKTDEPVELCSRVQCSWNEMFALAQQGLIDITHTLGRTLKARITYLGVNVSVAFEKLMKERGYGDLR